MKLTLITLGFLLVGAVVGQQNPLPPVAFKDIEMTVDLNGGSYERLNPANYSICTQLLGIPAVTSAVSLSYTLLDANGDDTVSDGKLSILNYTYSVKKANFTVTSGEKARFGCAPESDPNKCLVEVTKYTEYTRHADEKTITGIFFNLTPSPSYLIPVTFETSDGKRITTTVQFGGSRIVDFEFDPTMRLRPILAHQLFINGNDDAELARYDAEHRAGISDEVLTKMIAQHKDEALEEYNESIQLCPSWQAPHDARDALINPKNDSQGAAGGKTKPSVAVVPDAIESTGSTTGLTDKEVVALYGNRSTITTTTPT